MLFMGTVLAFAQQDALFTQYMFNKLQFNPGYAGSRDLLSIDLLTRFQWTGIEGAPRTISFSISSPLKEPHIGLGMYAYRDAIGPSLDYNVMGTFAYRVLFPAATLSFGISAGIKYYDVDWSQLNPKDAGDQEIEGQVKNRAVPDADFGIYFYSTRYYIGISSKHLLQNQVTVSSAPPGENGGYTRLMRNFYAIGGGIIPFSEDVVFRPSVLLKYVKNAPLQADFDACFFFRDLLMLGASYRTESALGLIAGIRVANGLTLGYSYDIWFNSLNSYNSGSHEIRISYELGIFPKRMLTPRYF